MVRAVTCIAIGTLSIVILACRAEPSALGFRPAGGPSSRMFASTFAELDGAEAPPFQGEWQSTASGRLALVPRRDLAGRVGLFGVFPSGRHEGVLWLSRSDGRVWHGIHADARSSQQVAASVSPGADQSRIDVRIGAALLSLERTAPARTDLLTRVAIIGHRAASLGRADRENSLAAIRDAWLFGASGVELDVTVPYSTARQPLPRQMRVHHPPEWRSELTAFDTSAESDIRDAPEVRAALRAAAESGLRTVYLDPKLRWLVKKWPDAAREALASLVADASASPEPAVMIGAETADPGEAADLLPALRTAAPWPPHVRWAFEITRGTDLSRATSRLAAAHPQPRPDAMSWNLLRLDGGGGGWLRWFVSTVPSEIETALGAFDGPVVVWTATDGRQFAAALSVLRRLQPGLGDAAIMTPYVHRLAFHLATER